MQRRIWGENGIWGSWIGLSYDEFSGQERWVALLAEPEELVEILLLQRGTFTWRPAGDAAFVGRMEEQLGRPLAMKRKPRKLLRLGAEAW